MSTSENTPRLAIFDLGNVVFYIDWEPMYQLWSAYSGVPADTLKARAGDVSLVEALERGEISGLEFSLHVNERLQIKLEYAQFCRGWNAIFQQANEDVAALLPALKQVMPVVAYSNTNTLHAQTWATLYAEVLAHFDEIFVSSAMGLRKPEPAGFHYLLDRRGVRPEDCVFFDDSEANVNAARALGIQSVLVDHPGKVRHTLRAMGIDLA